MNPAPVTLFPSGPLLALHATLFAIGTFVNICLIRMLRRGIVFRVIATAILTVWVFLTFDIGLLHASRWLPGFSWIRATGMLWFAITALSLPILNHIHGSKAVHPDRRRFLQFAAMAAVGAPLAAASAGFSQGQGDPKVAEIELPIAGLHPDLDGFKIVQISDIHMSPFLTRRQVARTVDLANGTHANLALVTGDLITATGDPLDECLAELKRLRADAGIYGCHGNHEILAGSEEYTTREGARLGMRFLRQQSEILRVGNAQLNLAGVDYQRKGSRYLQGVSGLRRDGCVNLLMSHNPDVLDAATAQHWDVVLAGHTHGGQVTLEYLHPALNPARFYTPYVYGMYRRGATSMYVTSGIGTVVVPVRIGKPSEIALLTLRKAL